MITLRIDRDTLTPDLRRLLRMAATNGRLATVIGRAGANVLKKHFRDRNKTPNKLGGKRTNFWSRVAESVQSASSRPGAIVIPISHPAIAQKVFGGTITPKKRKYLATKTKATAAAAGPTRGKVKRARAGLVFTMRGRTMFLALGDRLMYVLKRSVTQDPDPLALPALETMVPAIEKAARIALRRKG